MPWGGGVYERGAAEAAPPVAPPGLRPARTGGGARSRGRRGRRPAGPRARDRVGRGLRLGGACGSGVARLGRARPGPPARPRAPRPRRRRARCCGLVACVRAARARAAAAHLPVCHQPLSRARNPSRGAGRFVSETGCRSRSPQCRRMRVVRRSGSGAGSGSSARAAESSALSNATVSCSAGVGRRGRPLGRDRHLRAPPGGRELHCAAYRRALPGDGGLGILPGDAHLTERGQPSGEGWRVADLRPQFGRGLHEGALRTGLGHDGGRFRHRRAPLLPRAEFCNVLSRNDVAHASHGADARIAGMDPAERSMRLEPAQRTQDASIRRSGRGMRDRRVAEIAARQWGVVDHAQLLAAGLQRLRDAAGGRRGTTASGVSAASTPSVIRRCSVRARWLAAVLACGGAGAAVLSYRSAGALWDLRSSSRPAIDVTAPQAAHRGVRGSRCTSTARLAPTGRSPCAGASRSRPSRARLRTSRPSCGRATSSGRSSGRRRSTSSTCRRCWRASRTARRGAMRPPDPRRRGSRSARGASSRSRCCGSCGARASRHRR